MGENRIRIVNTNREKDCKPTLLQLWTKSTKSINYNPKFELKVKLLEINIESFCKIWNPNLEFLRFEYEIEINNEIKLNLNLKRN